MRNPDFSAIGETAKSPKPAKVSRLAKTSKPKPKRPATGGKQKRENEPYVLQHCELPESLKRRFDILFVNSRELKRRGKNNFLVDAIEAAVAAEEERQKPAL